jgi:hypothetical protein
MTVNTPQYITDIKGKRLSVVLPIRDYERLLEEFEDMEDVCLYDEAKKEDNGEYVLFSDYLKNRKKNA